MPAFATRKFGAYLVQQLGGIALGLGTTPDLLGVGTGPILASPTAVSLSTEVLPRINATISVTTTNVPNDTVTITALYTASTTITLTNAGVFDNLGTLLAITDLGSMGLKTSDTIQLTFNLVFV